VIYSKLNLFPGGNIDEMLSLASDFERDAPAMCSTVPPIEDLMAMLQMHLLRDSENPVCSLLPTLEY